MTLFWRILAGVGGVLLLLLIAVAIAVSTVDVNAFVGPIQKYVKEATGRELTIRGHIGLKVSLEPKVVVEDVSLGNASWGKAAQMITAKRVEVQLALLPLLHRDFQVRSLTLVEPIIALETDDKGTGNWEFRPPSPAGRAPSAAGSSVGGFFVGDLAISNGSLTYRDGETGKLTSVAIDDFAVNARDAQSPVSARFRGTIDDMAVAIEGDLGPLASLAQRRWPYPVSLKGQVNGLDTSVVAKLRVDDGTTSADPLDLRLGKSKVTGRLSVATGKPRPKLTLDLNAPTLALADLPGPPGPPRASATVAKPPPKSRYVFTEQPVDFAALKALDAQGELAADTLLLADDRKLEHVRVQFAVQSGVLNAPVIHAAGFGGTVSGQLRVDAAHDKDAVLNMHLDAKELDLSALLAAADIKREVRGGKTSLVADLATHGVSPRQWASDATGTVTAIVGPGTLGRPAGNADSAFNRLADAVNPFRKTEGATELKCAVVRLPLKNGVATIDRSIAIETSNLGATASGTVDFRNETLDLSIRPQLRKGIKLDISEFASLVRFHGPFTAPTVGVDAVASASVAATLGAAAATGGMSLLGQTLLSAASAESGAPCQIALGRASSAPDKSAPAKSTPPSDELGRAVSKLLGR